MRMMKKWKTSIRKSWIYGMIVMIFVIFVFLNIPVEKRKYGLTQTGLTTDYTGLLPEKIERVHRSKTINEMQKIVREANKNGKRISIAGVQHSQGGHTYYRNGIVFDMLHYNRIIEVNEQNKTVRVESGATWSDVQKAIAPYGLSLKVTQSQSIFTVGGSLSVNAHGRDIRNGTMASTVKSLTIITPTGKVETFNQKNNKEEMSNILGGYGLFGIILDVTLELTENKIYKLETEEIKMAAYEGYFYNILKNNKNKMHYARISVAPSTFLNEMYVINYQDTKKIDSRSSPKGENGMRISKLALDLGREGGKLEDLFWETQKLYIRSQNGKEMNRNDAMRSESTFMEFTKPNKVEALQEFFVPISQFTEYIEELKKILPKDDKDNNVKVHNITVRYAKKDEISSLPYAREDMLGLVVLLQHGTSKKEIIKAKKYIQKWTDITLKHGGTYYLPYYPYQTHEQFQTSYPNWKNFLKEKQIRDPNEIFQNLFYEKYFKNSGE